MEEKEYTKLELITILVKQMNIVMALIDTSKYYAIEGTEVVCYRREALFGIVPKSELSRQSFTMLIYEIEIG